MTKKFVKADLSNIVRKEQKQANYYRTNNDRQQKPRTRTNVSFQQKIQFVDLRKYFEVFPGNEEIKSLIEKFSGFFAEVSLHPEQIRSVKPSGDSFRNGFNLGQPQPQEQDQMPIWQSEGEVELGEKISQEIVNKVQHIAQKNIGELKQYEKDFLQEEFRKKLKIQHSQLKEDKVFTPPPKIFSTPITTLPSSTKPTHQAKLDDSDQEVDIKRTIHINRLESAEQHTHHRHEQLLNVADDEEDDGKFKDSSQESDDDIFGLQDKSEQPEDPKKDLTPTGTNHGQIKFAKGEFSMFALGHNIPEDQPIWGICDYNNLSKPVINLTSSWMDHNYVSNNMTYFSLVCFDPTCNNYIPYSLFQETHDINFFKFVANGTGNKKNKKHLQQDQQQVYMMNNNPMAAYPPMRKLSGQDIPEAKSAAGPNRKYSHNYKPKPQK